MHVRKYLVTTMCFKTIDRPRSTLIPFSHPSPSPSTQIDLFSLSSYFHCGRYWNSICQYSEIFTSVCLSNMHYHLKLLSGLVNLSLKIVLLKFVPNYSFMENYMLHKIHTNRFVDFAFYFP